MKLVNLIHIIIIILELIGFNLSYKHVGKQIIIYYTEISNFITLVSSILYLITDGNVPLLRYLSSCMLAMTALISLFVLSAQDGFKQTMLEGECLYHHTLIPLLSIGSYLFLEKHSNLWYIPVIISVIYGLLMIYLNYINVLKGPYDFFEINKNGIKNTIIWMIVLIAIISVISIVILKIGFYQESLRFPSA